MVDRYIREGITRDSPLRCAIDRYHRNIIAGIRRDGICLAAAIRHDDGARRSDGPSGPGSGRDCVRIDCERRHYRLVGLYVRERVTCYRSH